MLHKQALNIGEKYEILSNILMQPSLHLKISMRFNLLKKLSIQKNELDCTDIEEG